MDVLISAVAFRIAKWVVVRDGFTRVKIDDIIHNWGTCVGLGYWKERVIVAWCPPSGLIKFNLDGAAHGKLRASRWF